MLDANEDAIIIDFGMAVKSHPTFTAPGLTYGHNLRFERLYHPLKCEADAGIGALAAACAAPPLLN